MTEVENPPQTTLHYLESSRSQKIVWLLVGIAVSAYQHDLNFSSSLTLIDHSRKSLKYHTA